MVEGKGQVQLEKHELFKLLTKEKGDGPIAFEEAIKKTGFGKFNVFLLACSVLGIFSPMFETTTMSYIFAAAQCDLNLSLQDKGFLNSITFAGMISGSFIWGFLVDTFGRRKLMVYGYFLSAAFVFISSMSQSFAMLITCKFLGGFVINGPFSAMAVYLSEFHSSQYRSRIQLVNGCFTSVAQIILPLLAWGVLPLSVKWSLFNGSVEFHSWNLFLLITGLCPFISGIIFFFLPESPKYLMEPGENEKAIKLLQMVYSWNTGNSPDTYPVQALIQKKSDDIKDASEEFSKTKIQNVKEQISNLTPLFKPPYRSKFILICIILVVALSSLNMLRLWSPQLFQALEDYKALHNGSTTYLCTMLEVLTPKNASDACTTNIDKSMVYINSIMVSSFSVCCFIFSGTIVNILGKKRLLIILTILGSFVSCCLYFSYGAIPTTFLTAFYIGAGNVANNIIFAVIVDVFPTSIRAFAISLTLAVGRLGAMSGNIIFPTLIQLGCAPPFFVIAGFLAVECSLTFLLPNTENKPLE